MTLNEIVVYLLTNFEDVHQQTNYGYLFFFVGEDRRLPFVTIATEDNEYDKVSDLNREGVFRVNIGPGKEIFQRLFPETGRAFDYTKLDTFMPHPDYAAQFWICILSPGPGSIPDFKSFIAQAYQIAGQRDAKLNQRLADASEAEGIVSGG